MEFWACFHQLGHVCHRDLTKFRIRLSIKSKSRYCVQLVFMRYREICDICKAKHAVRVDFWSRQTTLCEFIV